MKRKSLIQKFSKILGGAILSLILADGSQALAATFRYELDLQPEGFTEYTEGATVVDGVEYDGTYISSAVNPVTGNLDKTFGTYNLLDGTLGDAATIEFLRDDYRVAERDGIITISYLSSPQDFDTIPDVISTFPEDTQEGLSQTKVVKLPDESLPAYDVLVIPSEFFAFPEFRDDEGNPTPIVLQGWSAEEVDGSQQVPEGKTVFALFLFGTTLLVKGRSQA